jgi:hypothetical protein
MNDDKEHISNERLVAKSLDGVDPARRELLKKLIFGAAVAVPVVASFSIRGLGLKQVYAQAATKVCVTPRFRRQTVTIVSISANCPNGSVVKP